MKVFPKSFSLMILGLKVPVKVIKNLREEKQIFGCYSPDKKIILIAEDQTKDEAVKTLVHEIWHSVEDRAGLGQVIPPDLSEIIAEQISVAITDNFTLSLKKK